jgi:hypothetical protein
MHSHIDVDEMALAVDGQVVASLAYAVSTSLAFREAALPPSSASAPELCALDGAGGTHL